MRSPRLRLLAVVAAPIILLTACSTDDGTDSSSTTAGPDDAAITSAAVTDGDLDAIGVELTAGEGDAELPGLTLDGDPIAEGDLPFGVGATETKTVTEGDGTPVAQGQQVTVRYLAVNGSTGEELLSTFPSEDTVVMDLTRPGLLAAFAQSLPGINVGSEAIMAVPPADGFGPEGNPSLGIGGQDTVLFYFEIVDAVEALAMAEGTAVEPPAGLPTVEADGANPATITLPEGEEPPAELVVQPLIEGERAPVEAGQSITVQYTGVKWSDGEQFDSSYTGAEPFTTTIGTGSVLPGWDEGLIGQPVGSRVLLVIPPEQAYGPAVDTESGGGNGLEGETLVFVIDILSAS